MVESDSGLLAAAEKLNACHKLHILYVEECFLLEQAEAQMKSENDLLLARESVANTRISWLMFIRQTMNQPSTTAFSLVAKAQMLIGLLRELCSEDDEVVSLTLTFAEDVDRLLRGHGSWN